MPHTLAPVFTHAHLLDFKYRKSCAGADSGACSSIVMCEASPARSQPPALWQAAGETTACTGREDLKAVRQARHYKEVGLQDFPLSGRATVSGLLYGVGVRMSLRRRTILTETFMGARSCQPSISHFSDRQTARRTQVC